MEDDKIVLYETKISRQTSRILILSIWREQGITVDRWRKLS